jgi:branched-subunit amino acid aminotransferase/4-amino-4-deoxychorismate lyase
MHLSYVSKVNSEDYNSGMTMKLLEISLQNNVDVETTASTLDGMTAALPVGFYTTFSTLAGGTKVLGLQAHLDRLYVPAKTMGLRPSVDEYTVRSRIAEIVQLNLPRETRMRLILVKESGRIYIAFQPFIAPPQEIYENGVHVITSDVSRTDPRIKGTDFITKSAEQRKLVTGDVYEILLVHNGRILEGMTSNFYAVKYVIASRQATRATQSGKQSLGNRGLLRAEDHRPRNDGILITARSGILLGVTRRAVLRIARGEGMFIEYRAARVDEKFDEAFLTSSSRGVVPIVKIDDQSVGQGRVGGWAKTLRKAYQAYVEERSERIVE